MIHHPAETEDSEPEDDEETREEEGEEKTSYHGYTCQVTGESEPLTITTASPPTPPRDLRVTVVDYNEAHIKWKPPIEYGAEVIGKVKGHSLKVMYSHEEGQHSK